MAITKEELDVFFKSENKQLIGEAVALAMQTDAGKSVLNNYLITSSQSIKDASFSEGQNKAYGYIDTVLSPLGIKYPDTVTKASDKVAYTIKNLQQQIIDVKSASPKDSSEELKALQLKLESAAALLREKEQTYATKIEKLSSNNEMAILNAVNLDVDASQAKESVEAFKKIVFGQLIKNKTIVGEVDVYNDEHGKPYLNPTTMAYATAEEVVKMKLAPILAKSNAGGDADKKQTSGKISDDNDIVLDKSKFNTTVELDELIIELLAKRGITKMDPRWNKIFEKAHEKYDQGLKEY